MAFSLPNLSVLAYANGFTLWHYKGGEATVAQVAVAGFLNSARDVVASGDIVMVSAKDGAKLLCVAAEADRITALPL